MGRKKKYNTEEERIAAKRERQRRWREKHKEKIAEYCQKNKDEIAEYYAEYYQNNKEKIAEYRAEYRSTPFGRAKYLESNYKRYDEENNRSDCTIDAQWIMDNVFSGQVCHYCGESDWRKLGCDRKDSSLPHTPENCVPCCGECNIKKNITPYDEFMRKIGRIKSGGSPTS